MSFKGSQIKVTSTLRSEFSVVQGQSDQCDVYATFKHGVVVTIVKTSCFPGDNQNKFHLVKARPTF